MSNDKGGSWSALKRREAIAGVVLVVLALGAAVIASRYPAGGRNTIGPSIFPLWSAGLFGTVGVFIIVHGLVRDRTVLAMGNAGPIAWIALSFAFFALTIESFGLLPATFIAAFAAGVAIPGQTWPGKLLTALFLSAAAAVFFVQLMGLPLRLWAWPS